jgi:hypothetical protein
MSRNFHETLTTGEVKPPSPRSTGIVFTVVALILAYLYRGNGMVLWPALIAAAGLGAASWLVPELLQPLNRLWFRFGLLLHKIVNPIVMLVLFGIVIVPAGLIMRIWHDPLRSRRDPAATSYWISRSDARPGSMRNQF